ncbi:flocculation protein FLO11-like isoform X3 [Portunus trituberculatus]|uniref:flocculation protein FLO11-like isoform X3 n=1 Tax=Portunus trituberculatus TaxID=210409 RepID=UPI001E1CD221|nr:flocculation protein FLO11-like isoform X3 [Portunus trituberculatus]
MPRCHRGRKNPRLAGHENLKIKSHVTRNEDETAARYESQTDSALESNSTARSGSQSKEEAGSEAPLPLTTGKGKRHGDLLSHRFSQSEKVSELTLSNGLSSCHDSAVSSCDGISSCSSQSLEVFSVESGCADQDKILDLSDSSSCANTTPLKSSEGVIFTGRLSRKNLRRRRQRKYKRFMLRQKREMANLNSQNSGCEDVETVNQEVETEVSEEVIQCKATPAVSNVDEEEVIAIINDNLQDLNGLENTQEVDRITSPEDNEDIVIAEILESEKKESDSHHNIPSLVVEDEVNTHGVSEIPGGMREEVLLHPSEQLELLDVMKAVNDDDPDIAIFEIKSNILIDSEDDESGVHTEGSSEGNGETLGEECHVSEAVTEPPNVEEEVSPDVTGATVDAALAELDSIPDEVCESGDVEEEDEEEEEWSYYRMDLQTQPQGEDVLVPGSSEVMDQNQDKAGTPSADITQEQPKELETGNGLGGPSLKLMEDNHTDDVEIANQSSLLSRSPDLFQTEAAARLNKETNLMETSISNVGEYLDNYEPSSSPHAPGSPRSVEGFVTSVELNTPEEIGGVAHPQDVNGSGVEQSSGPFSVYVSSSPEPVSLDPHLQTSGDFDSVSELTNGQVGNEIEASGDFSPVEIVHAQSTVEVVASPTPSEKREGEMPEVPTSPTAPVNQTVDVTFIPEPAVEPTAEKPVPVFIDEGTPVSEGEPEIPSSVLADMHTSEPATADFLSREPSGELLVMKETCTAESPVPELQALVEGTSIPHDEAPTSEPMSPVFDTASPLMEETPVEAGVPSSMEPTLFNVSSTLEPSPALASPVEMTTTKPLSAPMSPVQEPSPAPMSPVQEPSPAPLSPVQEPSPAPLSPVHEPSPAPMSPVQEPSPTPMSPVQEPSPAPMSPVQEPSPAPMSPVQEPSPAPMSPVQEPSPVTISPIQEPSPAPAFPVEEPVPAPASPVEKPVPAPASPDEEPAPAPASPVQEPSPTPLSPVEEAIPTPVSLVEKPAVAPVSPVEEPAPTPVSTVEDPALITSLVTEPAQAPLSAVLDPSPVPEHAVEEEAPLTLSPVVLETQAGPPSVIPDIMETAAVNTGKDEIQINKGTVVIPVVAQDDVKETKPEVAKSPAKTAKTPGKAADKAGKQTPSKSTPGKATPTRTPSSRTPLTKPTEKKPTPSSQTLKSTSTRPAAEKTTAPRTRVTPTSSATSKQALTKPSTKPVARTTTAKPSTTTTTTKPAEKRAPKPATPTTPRAALSKPSAAPSKSAQSSTAGRATTTTTATKRPISAPTRRVEKTDTSKVNGTATKPSRTTTSRPATASTATRKPLSATARSVPEKETKNTTNRILSTTTKSVQKSSPGTARSVTSKATALAKTAGKVDGTSSATTTTSKARMTSVTKSSTTTKATGVTAKKTLVSKTSTTKSKTAAAATSSKVQKSEVILAPVTNGENKIAHEETSVEVIEKCAAEDVVQCSTTEQVISTETVEVIVNGDH